MKVRIQYLNERDEVIASDEFQGIGAMRQFQIAPALGDGTVLVGYQLQTILGVRNQAQKVIQ